MEDDFNIIFSTGIFLTILKPQFKCKFNDGKLSINNIPLIIDKPRYSNIHFKYAISTIGINHGTLHVGFFIKQSNCAQF